MSNSRHVAARARALGVADEFVDLGHGHDLPRRLEVQRGHSELVKEVEVDYCQRAPGLKAWVPAVPFVMVRLKTRCELSEDAWSGNVDSLLLLMVERGWMITRCKPAGR